jgi:hypothetical protein
LKFCFHRFASEKEIFSWFLLSELSYLKSSTQLLICYIIELYISFSTKRDEIGKKIPSNWHDPRSVFPKLRFNSSTIKAIFFLSSDHCWPFHVRFENQIYSFKSYSLSPPPRRSIKGFLTLKMVHWQVILETLVKMYVYY